MSAAKIILLIAVTVFCFAGFQLAQQRYRPVAWLSVVGVTLLLVGMILRIVELAD